MPITRMNHAVLYVRDATVSQRFYHDVLGFETLVAHPDGLEFEVMWLVPPDHWGEAEHQAIIETLDIDAEIQHYASVGLA